MLRRQQKKESREKSNKQTIQTEMYKPLLQLVLYTIKSEKAYETIYIVKAFHNLKKVSDPYK